MRDPARIEKIIGALRTLWQLNPDLRLGQLIINLTTGAETYQVEDDEMHERILASINRKWPTVTTERMCAKHEVPLVYEPGGPDRPTIRGVWRCPECNKAFMAALEAQDG